MCLGIARARKILEFHLARWANNPQFLLARDTSLFAQVFKLINPLMPNSDLQILLCLMPDDFTRQMETPWALKDIRTQKFPRTDFFKTLTAGTK